MGGIVSHIKVLPDSISRVGAAYNNAMKHVHAVSLRFTLATAALIACAANSAFAQTGTASAPAVSASGTAAGSAGERPEPSIQRIRTEDAGTRIDELRVGGETQSITVQPKTGPNTPAYEVKPSDSAKGNALSQSSGDTNGSRVWNVLKF